MKTPRLPVTVVALVAATTALPLLHAATSSGGPYTLTANNASGGGGSSTGATYAIQGTTGQPDGATLTGGSFTLTGGFWGITIVIPTPNAPNLVISHASPTVVRLRWPATGADGFQLETTTSLAAPAWSPVPGGFTPDGADRYQEVNSLAPLQFFRLRKP